MTIPSPSRAPPANRPSRSRNELPPSAWFELEAARILLMIGALPMVSEIGGKKLVTDFRSMIQREVANALAKGRAQIMAATGELTREIEESAAGAARVIREEARAVKDGFAEYLGNNAPETEEGKPDPTQSQSGGGTEP